ncbi:Secondary metabolism regulator laeA [Paramyrothecium foliicola]|nr:Secondary metabolism regulator laeA [Paramyrothecium foliicola]
MSEKYPQMHIQGVDINMIQPRMIPPGMEPPKLLDIEGPWEMLDFNWDFFHLRMLFNIIQCWPSVYDKIFTHLNPGTGYIEHVEVDWTLCCDDGSLPDDSALNRWSLKISHATEVYSRPIRVQPELVRHQLEAASFVNIEEVISPLYLNHWPSGEKDSKQGKWLNLGFCHSLEALSIMPMVTMLGMPEDEIKSLCDQAKAEACMLKYHAYCKIGLHSITYLRDNEGSVRLGYNIFRPRQLGSNTRVAACSCGSVNLSDSDHAKMTGPIPTSSSAVAPALHPNNGTPPESRAALPLTPPLTGERQKSSRVSVDKILVHLEKLANNQPIDVLQFELTQQEYIQLRGELLKHSWLDVYIEDKLGIDYDPTSEVLHIRMPSPIHDFFVSFLDNDIQKKLDSVVEQRQDTVGAFAAQIRSGRSSRLRLPTEGTSYIERHPDAQFQHLKSVYPGVVCEVSYSQDGKDLRKLAWQYIVYSGADIKAVIGIDINDDPKPSTVSVWRPQIVRDLEGTGQDSLEVVTEVDSQAFRSANGEHVNQSQELQLSLNDFATDKLWVGGEAGELVVTFERLAQLLDDAEEMQKSREVEGDGIKSQRELKRPRWDSSSPDYLRTDDEDQFLLDEERAVARADATDVDFEDAKSRRKIKLARR